MCPDAPTLVFYSHCLMADNLICERESAATQRESAATQTYCRADDLCSIMAHFWFTIEECEVEHGVEPSSKIVCWRNPIGPLVQRPYIRNTLDMSTNNYYSLNM